MKQLEIMSEGTYLNNCLDSEMVKRQDIESSKQPTNIRYSSLRDISIKIIKALEKLCGLWGRRVANNPKLSVFVCLIFVACCGCGLISINIVYRPYDLWVPKHSEFFKVTKWKTANFPSQYRKQIGLWQAENILTADNIKNMLEFEHAVENVSVIVNKKLITWNDVCVSFYTEANDKRCLKISILDVWNYNNSIIEALTDEKVLEDINDLYLWTAAEGRKNVSSYIGGIAIDDNGKIIGAKSTLQTWFTVVDDQAIKNGKYEMDVATGEKVDIIGITWEREFVRIGDRLNLSVNINAGYSLSNVLMNTIIDDSVWILAGWGLLTVYVVLTLGQPFHSDHRLMPAIVGLVSIAMAVLSSFGLCSLFGIPYGTLNNVLPVLLVALGVDDMYVIITAWDSVCKYDELIEVKAQLTMEKAGMAITVTSLTNILAFLVGTMTSLPGLRWFCIYSAVGIFIVYFLQITLFLASMVINQKWQISRKVKTLSNKISELPSNVPAVTEKLKIFKLLAHWGKVLSFCYVKIIVILLTSSMFLFSCYHVLDMSKEFDTMWLLPKTSRLYEWYNSVERIFALEGEKGAVYFKGVQIPEEIAALNNLVANLAQCPYVSKTDAWFTGIDVDAIAEEYPWIHQMSKHDQCDMLLKYIDLKYRSHFAVSFKSGEHFNEEYPCSSFMIEFQYISLKTEQLRQAAMNTVRSLVRRSNVTGYKIAWAHVYSYWETEHIIMSELVQSLALVLSVVGLISLILLASLRAAILVLVCVIATLTDVACFVHLWGLTINTITCIAFVIAVGICVDYAAHIAHDFMIVRGTIEERISLALHHIGSAVLHGGFSTLIAFLALAPSGSYIFVSYFKILTGVSTFGLFHALVFLPVLLSLFGPDAYPDPKSINRFKEQPVFHEISLKKSISIYTINMNYYPYLNGSNDCCKSQTHTFIPTHRRAHSMPSKMYVVQDSYMKRPTIFLRSDCQATNL